MLAHVVAQTASGEGQSFDIFSLLLPLALAFLIFSMFRRQRKAQQQVKEMRTQMEPGTEVMTQFGLFGTIVSIDQENNKAVLELSPGTRATVHTQALSKVVQHEPAAADDHSDDDALQGSTVPDDASSLDVDRPAPAPAAGTTSPSSNVETPEETLARLDRERIAAENGEARAARDPKANPDN